MKKKDFLKLAMIGLASGACIAAQYSASNDLDLDHMLAMTKCTKDQKQDRDMDRSMDDGSCGGSGGCEGNSDKSSCSSCNSDSCENGRKATRDEIFGRNRDGDQKMDQKRCGKFY